MHNQSLPTRLGDRYIHRSVRFFLIFPVCLWLFELCGCSSNKPSSQSRSSQSSQLIDPQLVQARMMSFADRYMAATSDVYNEVELSCRTSDSRIMAQQCRLSAGAGAVGNAVNPNPIAGMMDMALMVSITRDISGQRWAVDAFGQANARAITTVLAAQEKSIWSIVEDYLTADQVRELRVLGQQWLADHPHQRFVEGARLAEFSPPKSSSANASNGALSQLTTSVVSLVKIDPFNGLDPAIQQVEQSRVLAERAFFYLQHMPTLLAWQTDLLYSQMLANPQSQQVLEATTTIANSTASFTDASNRFADTVEKFRVQLPQQQKDLVDQLNGLVSTQSNGALHAASTQVSTITSGAIRQLDTTVGVQQDLLTNNLQRVMNDSIDRLYWRLRTLVFIAAGVCVAAPLLYRLIVGRFGKRIRKNPDTPAR